MLIPTVSALFVSLSPLILPNLCAARALFAVSSTGAAYGSTTIGLCACYLLPRTDLAYDATRMASAHATAMSDPVSLYSQVIASYASATPCPVLTLRMMLPVRPGRHYGLSGTRLVCGAICLRDVRYAMSGTDLPYGATRS
eukprot:1707823-Rhodomonas_salina.3